MRVSGDVHNSNREETDNAWKKPINIRAHLSLKITVENKLEIAE